MLNKMRKTFGFKPDQKVESKLADLKYDVANRYSQSLQTIGQVASGLSYTVIDEFMRQHGSEKWPYAHNKIKTAHLTIEVDDGTKIVANWTGK